MCAGVFEASVQNWALGCGSMKRQCAVERFCSRARTNGCERRLNRLITDQHCEQFVETCDPLTASNSSLDDRLHRTMEQAETNSCCCSADKWRSQPAEDAQRRLGQDAPTPLFVRQLSTR